MGWTHSVWWWGGETPPLSQLGGGGDKTKTQPKERSYFFPQPEVNWLLDTRLAYLGRDHDFKPSLVKPCSAINEN